MLCCVLSSLSLVRLFATPWVIACQAPLSIGFSRQEYWSGLPCPLPGDLPNPGIKPRSPILQANSLPSEPPGKPKSTAVGSPPFSRDLLNPGIKPGSPALQADSLLPELAHKIHIGYQLQNFHSSIPSFSPSIYYLLITHSVPPNT